MNEREFETIEEIITDNYTRGYNDGVNHGLECGNLRTSETLDKISAEIKDTCTWDDKTLTPTIGAEKVLEIIEKYKEASK